MIPINRTAYTTAPHPITGHDAHLEIFEMGADTIIRATNCEPRTGRDTIIHAGQGADRVMRSSGLFWHLDAAAPPPAPVQLQPVAGAYTVDRDATVCVYDDGSGRALIQRKGTDTTALTVTWKSPEYDAEQWIEVNSDLDWLRYDPSAPAQATPAAPAPIVDEHGYTIDPDHVHFQAKHLWIGWAVTYQDAPRSKGTTDNGGTMQRKTGLRWPLLVAGDYVEDGKEVCEAVAAILERNKAEMGAK